MTVADFQQQYSYPHCDAQVLHAPLECKFCDYYPDRQQERVEKKINFTGHNRPDFERCPSEQARDLSIINRWGGNVPRGPELPNTWVHE